MENAWGKCTNSMVGREYSESMNDFDTGIQQSQIVFSDERYYDGSSRDTASCQIGAGQAKESNTDNKGSILPKSQRNSKI